MALTSLRPTRPDPAVWRKAIGRRLRAAREAAGLRLVDVARLARVSPQYLSEVERGRKEASSEVLSAVTGALGMTLVDLAGGVARDLSVALATTVPTGRPRPEPTSSTAGGSVVSLTARAEVASSPVPVVLALAA
jgi:transcriptional regulator with XRE-family HTH domain